MILLDTSGLFAALNDRQPEHTACRLVLDAESPPLILSPFVLAELDYFIERRVGVEAELALLEDVARGAYDLAEVTGADLEQAAAVIERYRDLKIGLADASIVVLAGRHRTNRVLTLDERHFQALTTPEGKSFVVLPADA